MCGHIFLDYQGHQPLRQHRPLWRCSACGRQSHLPIDCCAHPAYHASQPNRILSASMRWLGDLMSRMQMSIQSQLIRNPQPDVDSALAKIDPSIAPDSLGDAWSSDNDKNQLDASCAAANTEESMAMLGEIEKLEQATCPLHVSL